MFNSKSTKHALLVSMLAVVMCVAMLIGTTFAWFTDVASTAVNRVQSGILTVDIVKEDGRTSIKGESMSFVNLQGSDDILWEPGATFKTPAFKIKSIGTLALKYKIALTGIDGDNKLLDVIKFSVVNENGDVVDLDQFVGRLTPDAPLSDALYIQGTMDKDAGNKYQDKTLSSVGITVVATQYTHEYDSNNNRYDEGATFPAINTDELKIALENVEDGDVITLAGDADFLNETVLIEKDITISGEDASIQNVYFTVADGKKVSFKGVNIDGTTTVRAVDDAEITFENCKFSIAPEKKNNNGRAAAIIGTDQHSNVNLTLNGCIFDYNNSGDDKWNMAVFMWSNVENVLIKDCVFNDYGFVAVKFLEMKAGANIVFDGNTFNMSGRSAENWYYNTAVQIHSVNQPAGNCNISFINNKFNGDYQTGAESEYTGYEESSAPIVAELLWNADTAIPLVNTTLTISGNTVNGSEVTEANFVFNKGEGSSVIAK